MRGDGYFFHPLGDPRFRDSDIKGMPNKVYDLSSTTGLVPLSTEEDKPTNDLKVLQAKRSLSQILQTRSEPIKQLRN